MIVRFTTTPEAFLLADVEESRRCQTIQNIVWHWKLFGGMRIFGGNTGRRKLVDALDSLPVDQRKRWKTAIANLKPRIVEHEFVLCSNPDVLKKLTSEIDLCAITKEQIHDVFPDSESIPQHIFCGCPEITQLRYTAEAELFMEKKETLNQPIASGTAVDSIWKKIFSPLARESKHITVIDRYCAVNLEYSLRKGNESGIASFIHRLSGCQKTEIEIITAFEKDTEPQFRPLFEKQIEEAIQEVLRNKESGESISITIKLLPNHVFGTVAHDRYVFFDRRVVELGIGLEVFEGNKTRRLSSFSMSCRSSVHDKMLVELNSHVRNLGRVIDLTRIGT